MKFLRPIALSSMCLLLACGPAATNESADKTKRPTERVSIDLLDSKDKTVFAALPLEGKLEDSKKYWSGNHWPLNKGLINWRWNSESQEGHDYVSPNRDEAMLLSETELMELSPSEKFDLLMGRYEYPLKKEVEENADAEAKDWEGIGNGWALATAHHAEPSPVTLTNADGINIPFGSSDIKALLAYYYAFHHKAPVRKLGARCETNGDGCLDDLDAGDFHLVLANKVGRQTGTLIMDIDRLGEVWNHPVVSYKSEVLAERLPEADETMEAVKVLHVRSTVHYVEKAANSWWPVKRSWNQLIANRSYEYELFVDGAGGVVSGEWKSVDRPDFIWAVSPVTKFSGILEGLEQLADK